MALRLTQDGRTLIVGALLLLLPLRAFAQRPTATVVGIVKDSTGGVIHGATVTATDEARGFTRSIVTNAAGIYSLPALDAGRYQLRVVNPKFRTKVVTASPSTWPTRE